LGAAGMLMGQASAATASFCARPAELAAFDVAGLKSQLMVTALSCAAQDKYNAFIVRFRPEMMTEERALTGYFGRTYGRRGQARHDDYVTSLANEQSEAGTKLGTDFCSKKVSMFDEVMALPSLHDLPTYAAGKSLVQPISLVSCPVVTRASRVPVRHKRKPLHS
jgi:hypothetical protein